MKPSSVIQVLGLVLVPFGAFVLWHAGAAILAAGVVLVVLGVVLEREGS